MPDIKRITPDEVKAAYEKTGMMVTRHRVFGGGGKCGCALGAYSAANLGVDPRARSSVNQAFDALKAAGFTYLYRSGFSEGFDGHEPLVCQRDIAERRVGHEDGKAAWEAVAPK